jgi:predicted TPR repeat methyltransferase
LGKRVNEILVKHYEKCLKEHGDTHKGMDWPDEAGKKLRYSVLLELTNRTSKIATLLDLGCGTGQMYQFLQEENNKKLIYNGLDLSAKMVSAAKKNGRMAILVEVRSKSLGKIKTMTI